MTDRRIFMLVIAFLGATLVVCTAGTVLLVALDKSAPDLVGQLAVGCLTGLAGLLARGPSTEPQEVFVRQPAGEAVPVDEQ